MYLKVFMYLCFFGGTLASETGVGEDQNLRNDLKTCLPTVIKELCPDCITVHLVTPMKPSWEADALASHFRDSTLMYALTIYTMDRAGFEDPLDDQVGLYLANSDADLTMALKNLRETNLKRNCVIWVNFHFGRSLDNYLKRTTPATWNLGRGWSIIFVGLIEGDVQVFGTPIQKSQKFIVNRFSNLSLCETEALIKVPQPLSKAVQSRKLILTIFLRPAFFPFVERHTDNPGGLIEDLINLLKTKFDFKPKYNWSHMITDSSKLLDEHTPSIVYNLLAGPKTVSPSSVYFASLESFWVIATPNPPNRQNFLALPLKTNILLHSTLLAIYTSVIVLLSRDLDKTRMMLRLFGMFFGIGVGWFPRKALLRFLVVLWCFTSYILVQAYLSAVTSELSSPISYNEIRDTEDLVKSGIDIYCSTDMKELYCSLGGNSNVYICEKAVVIDSNWYSHLLKDKLRTNKSWNPFAFPADTDVCRNHLVGKPFHIMPERIGMWPGFFDTNLDKRFQSAVAEIIKKLREAGILRHLLKNHYRNNITNHENESEMLSMSHLSDIFIILYVGWACSFLVLLIEIIIKW